MLKLPEGWTEIIEGGVDHPENPRWKDCSLVLHPNGEMYMLASETYLVVCPQPWARAKARAATLIKTYPDNIVLAQAINERGNRWEDGGVADMVVGFVRDYTRRLCGCKD